MAVSIAALTTKGNPLPNGVLQKMLEACDQVLDLDSARTKVLEFVESKMGSVAPNLSAIVGSAVAAKLMGTAGGFTALAKMPACDVQVLGHKRKNLVGFTLVLESPKNSKKDDIQMKKVGLGAFALGAHPKGRTWQGIELCNLQALGLGSGIQSTYFSEAGTFSKFE
ncbi:unnamed protein product [Microthlaspi erraticum]|uniref:Nop domain-containing protein n=1 Tax=Microthlaspi erraticum TaxID=1685480 RepID=A0A6D2L7B6_9BRAS|nr:unnamed protein product [Microthlaspi erraticum]